MDIREKLKNKMDEDVKKNNNNLEIIQRIADKTPTYNIDINQHIESCRISINIINQKEETIKILRDMLEKRD